MNLYACRNEVCPVILFKRALAHCPACWTGARKVTDSTLLDELLTALDKSFIPSEQLTLPKLAADGPSASELRRRVELANRSNEPEA